MPRQKPAMSYSDIAMVLARALRDRAFRRRLADDPVNALRRAFPESAPGPETVKFFKSLKADTFNSAADTLNEVRDPLGGAGDMSS